MLRFNKLVGLVGLRRKVLHCPCGARHNMPEGAVRLTCPKCGREFGEPKEAPNRTREMERRVKQEAKRKGGSA